MIRETLLKASKLGHGARSIGRRGNESTDRKRETTAKPLKHERNHASLIGERANNRASRESPYRELYFQLYTYFITAGIHFPRWKAAFDFGMRLLIHVQSYAKI